MAHRGIQVRPVTADDVEGFHRLFSSKGCPWDAAGLSGTGPAKHWGHSKVYRAAGFRPDEGRRWVRKL